jgi:hypothetical protein
MSVRLYIVKRSWTDFIKAMVYFSNLQTGFLRHWAIYHPMIIIRVLMHGN